MLLACAIYAVVKLAQAIEPCDTLVSLEHGHGGEAAGEHALFGVDTHRTKSFSRPAGARIQDVAVTSTVDLQVALVIAAGGKGSTGKLDIGNGDVGSAWVAYAYRPRSSVRVWPNDANIAAQIYQAVSNAAAGTNFSRPIGRIFLADAAEVEFDTRHGKLDAWSGPHEFVHAY